MTNYPESFYSSVTKRAQASSEIVAEILQDVLKPRSIIDVGSGEGAWINTMSHRFPSALDLTAIDLQPHRSEYFEQLSSSKLNFEFILRDFEKDHTLPNQNYDLAICLEVLEHLQTQTAEQLAAEFAKNCSVLIFSAAVKGQGGTGHINENSLDYWIRLFQQNDFIALDILRPKLARNKQVPDYYKQNMILLWHPENCIKNNTVFDLEALLIKNPIAVADTRKFLMKLQHFVISFLPHRVVTNIVVFIDKTVRR